MKQIALAIHNYHTTNGAFPPGGASDMQGELCTKTGISLNRETRAPWTVRILPQLEQQNRYDRFDFQTIKPIPR